MNDFEDQKDLNPLDTLTTVENSTDSTIQPDSEIQPILTNSESQTKPKPTTFDNLLRGCGYILISVTILVLLMFGACFIMIAGSSFQ